MSIYGRHLGIGGYIRCETATKENQMTNPVREECSETGTQYNCWRDENGMKHRLDGPAVEWDGGESWYYHGIYLARCYSQETFEKIIKLVIFGKDVYEAMDVVSEREIKREKELEQAWMESKEYLEQKQIQDKFFESWMD
jgi:hypothetical protein